MKEKKEKTVTARLPVTMIQRLDRRSEERDMSRSALIRQALKRYLK